MGSIPGPGRFHMPQSNWAHGPQLLSLCVATTEACAPRACAVYQEKPLQGEARALPTTEEPLLTTTRESPCSDEDPAQAEKRKYIHIHTHIYIWKVNGEWWNKWDKIGITDKSTEIYYCCNSLSLKLKYIFYKFVNLIIVFQYNRSPM